MKKYYFILRLYIIATILSLCMIDNMMIPIIILVLLFIPMYKLFKKCTEEDIKNILFYNYFKEKFPNNPLVK